MKIKALLLILIVFLGCTNSKKDSNQEKSEWQSLFNGENLDEWKIKIAGSELGVNYKNTFQAGDGVIKVVYTEYDTFLGEFGHLFYQSPFSHYHLKLEYRFVGEQVPGGPGWAFRNSGAMLHCQNPESMTTDQNFPVSIEAQFLGGNGKDERSTLNLCTPGTNVVMDGKLITNHCISSSSKTYHGDQWVTAEMIVLGDSIVHHVIEGDTILTYENPQIGGNSLPENYPSPDGTLIQKGYIALQAESHPLEFRNIVLKTLN